MASLHERARGRGVAGYRTTPRRPRGTRHKMGRMGYNQARLRRLNDARIAPGGDYVLYWMQLYRRLERNHALDYALAVRAGARPASRRLRGPPHRLPLGEPPPAPLRPRGHAGERRAGRGARPQLLAVRREAQRARGAVCCARLSARAALVVTDDFPCFIVPAQAEALARRAAVPVFAVDVELASCPCRSSAPRSRRRRTCAPASTRPSPRRGRTAPPRGRDVPDVAARRVKAPFDAWKAKDVAAFVDSLRPRPVGAGRPADAGRRRPRPAAACASS